MKHAVEIEVTSIDTIQAMSDDEYLNYLDNDLFYVDHHGLLRSAQADYVFATSKAQLNTLIKFLDSIKDKIERD